MGLALVLAVGLFFHYGRLWRFDTIFDRVYFWKIAWTMWKEHPVVGVGISSFQDAYKEMAASGTVSGYNAPNGVVYQALEQTHAHSLFFMLISCTGLFGLAAFIGLFIAAGLSIFRNTEGYRIGLVTWPAVVLAIGISGFNIFHSWYQALFAFFLVLIGSRPVKVTPI
jgi:O-antigen ligase